MSREQAISLKALRFVTVAISLVTLSVFVTLGYSVYSEVSYMMSGTDVFQPRFGLATADGKQQFQVELTVPNRGLYPMELSLDGTMRLEGSRIASGSSGTRSIQPGREERLGFVISVDLSELFSDKLLAERMIFKGADITISMVLQASLIPFVGLNASTDYKQSVSPMIGELRLEPEAPRPFNVTHTIIPIQVSFKAGQFIPSTADLTAHVVKTPKTRVEGDYGAGSLKILVSPEERYSNTLNLLVKTEYLASGKYTIEFSISSAGLSYTWRTEVNV